MSDSEHVGNGRTRERKKNPEGRSFDREKVKDGTWKKRKTGDLYRRESLYVRED